MSGKHRSGRIERERARRQASQPAPSAPTNRNAPRTCPWCGGPVYVGPVGRIPTWCSQTCRQRAWEQRRAAESGLAAVRVVERVVERRVAVPAEGRPPRRDEWPPLLEELTHQLSRGQIYPRDLPNPSAAIDHVMAALRRATRCPEIMSPRRPTLLAFLNAVFRRDDSRVIH